MFPRKTTRTAQYAAVAVKTSCRLALLNTEHEAENTSVKTKMVRICNLLLRPSSSAFVGCNLNRMSTGTSSRAAARIVSTNRRKISSRRGSNRATSSSPETIFCSLVRKSHCCAVVSLHQQLVWLGGKSGFPGQAFTVEKGRRTWVTVRDNLLNLKTLSSRNPLNQPCSSSRATAARSMPSRIHRYSGSVRLAVARTKRYKDVWFRIVGRLIA